MPELRWIRPDLNENARQIALAMLSNDERYRYRATPEARRDSFLCGRLILRRLVSELTGVGPSEVQLSAHCPDCGGPHGRPVAAGTGLHLSLTHGADAVVAAASDRPVGIDLEASSPAAAVLVDIRSLTGHASLQRWTQTEAILKADGRGLRVDPAHVMIDGTRGWVDDSAARYELSEVELSSGVCVSVAVAA
jgi:4'-phosphopantetheinyl transferase